MVLDHVWSSVSVSGRLRSAAGGRSASCTCKGQNDIINSKSDCHKTTVAFDHLEAPPAVACLVIDLMSDKKAQHSAFCCLCNVLKQCHMRGRENSTTVIVLP